MHQFHKSRPQLFASIDCLSKEELANQVISEQIEEPFSVPSPNQVPTRPSIQSQVLENRSNRPISQPIPIHPVEPVIGLTPEEQEIQEAEAKIKEEEQAS